MSTIVFSLCAPSNLFSQDVGLAEKMLMENGFDVELATVELLQLLALTENTVSFHENKPQPWKYCGYEVSTPHHSKSVFSYALTVLA